MVRTNFTTNRFVQFGLMVAAGLLLSEISTAAATHQNTGASIRLWSETSVGASQITLGDIASVTGDETVVPSLKNLVLASNLPTGRKITYRAHEIVDRLGNSGFDVGRINLTGAASCVVTIATTPAADTSNDPSSGLSPDQASRLAGPASLESRIRELICRNLQTRSLPREQRVRISFNPALRDLLALTDPPYTFEIVPQRTNTWVGLVTFRVKVAKDGKVLQSLTVLAEVQVRVQLLVASKTINSKAKITKTEVETTWQDVTNLKSRFVTRIEDVLDQQARKIIPSGTVITSDLLEPVPMVRRGQLVTVVYQSGGLGIRIVGKALATAFRNEIIQVRNERSKEVFRARVIGPGQVAIEDNLGAEGSRATASASGGSNP